jgi:hypothetical protein
MATTVRFSFRAIKGLSIFDSSNAKSCASSSGVHGRLMGRGPRFISLSDYARPAGGRFRPFSVTALQLRINCLAGSLKHGGHLDDGLAGLEQVVQPFLFVGGPPPLRWR